MKKLLFYSPAILLTFLLTSPQVSARTSINVNSTTNGTGSTVRVESNTNQSSDVSLNQSNSETKIRLEQNGEVKTFEARGDEDISWDSEDGSASIRVNQSQSASVQKNVESSDSGIESEQENEDKGTDTDKESENKENTGKDDSPIAKIIESIKDFISSFFN